VSPGSLTSQFSVTNGFGDPILPHRIRRPDAAGLPTAQIVEIRDLTTLVNNLPSATNPVLPGARWPAAAVLPNNLPGNHYVLIEFGPNFIPSETSILNAGAASGLTGALTVSALDPTTGVEQPIKGRMFVNGRTAEGGAILTWLSKGPAAASTLSDTRKAQVQAGFPGIASTFSGSKDLVSPRAVVFIPDADDDLSTFEAFPANRNIRVSVGVGVKSKSGAFWPAEAVGVSTVGADTIAPEVAVNAGPLTPQIEPPLNASMVSVDKRIEITYTEPVQPYTIGPLPALLPPPVTGGVRVSFQVGQNSVLIPFSVLPANALNFTKMVLTPAFSFPGSYFKNGPAGLPDPADVIFTVNIDLSTTGTVQDLSLLGTSIPRTSLFRTGPGTGIVNAPVAPEAIYLGFGGESPGLGVLDLDGFGQGTGTPLVDNPLTIEIEEGVSNFPNNPDLNAGLTPPLVVESTPLSGGSLGPLTLSRDSSGENFVFAQPPLVNGVRDMAIGPPLDTLFNNGICQSGGGNVCAKDASHISNGNTIAQAPVPNPPKLTFPPLCLSPFIPAQEPVSIINAPPPPAGPGLLGPYNNSLLKPGNFKGDKANGIPPQGLFTNNPNVYGPFWPGPSPAPSQPPFNCINFYVRQQIGQFLYVIDPVVRRVVVMNSNRMSVITSIPQPDPVNLAMSPSLKVLSVSNAATNQIHHINTDPFSVDFHKVVKITNLGAGAAGIAWQPDGEELLATLPESNQLLLINGLDFTVRKAVSNQLNKPFEVVATSRQFNFGFNTGVYFAYVLNTNGSVAVYESGPSGLQGYGFDDLIGTVSSTFPQPTAMQADVTNLNSGVWIVHKNSASQATASNLVLTSSPVGPIPFNQFIIFPSPSFRNREFKVVQTVNPSQISGGAPQDIAFDDTFNTAGTPAQLFLPGGFGTPGATIPHSSKKHVRGVAAVTFPRALFLANFDVGTIDVIDRVTGLKIVEPITAPGVQRLCHYFRE